MLCAKTMSQCSQLQLLAYRLNFLHCREWLKAIV